MNTDQGRERWADAERVAALIAIDPVGLGGVCVRAGHGPERDRWMALLRDVLPESECIRRVPSHISEGRLLGGLDLTATLRAGHPVVQRGVLAEADGGFVLLPMAERIPAATIAHITAVLDTGEIVLEREGLALRSPTRFGVIALDEGIDEGIDEDEQPRAGLLDRLAFLLDLSDLRAPGVEALRIGPSRTDKARALLDRVRVSDEIREALCMTAMKLGIASIRASMMALRAAHASAALDGRLEVNQDDAVLAARLVLATRATVLPEMDSAEGESTEQSPEQNPPSPDAANSPGEMNESESETERTEAEMQELVLAAAQAAIPRGLLERLRIEKTRPSRTNSNGRAGALRQSLLRGRPAGVRRGEPRAGIRLNLVETLRAAAPWQPLRRSLTGGSRRVEIRSEDFHVTRYKQRTQTTTIFVVDASGSSALNRLAEAKGAVELLLADCYVRRDQVAVIAFRGRGAELLLPPTRSLVRAKRSLAGLPGGGGTPLAAGIDAGLALAEQLRRGGQTPALVMLTDGRANVARDGSGNRDRAETEARAAAGRVRAASITSLFIDTSPRAQAQAEQLAAEMSARYLPLPYAGAARLSTAVRSVMRPGRDVR